MKETMPMIINAIAPAVHLIIEGIPSGEVNVDTSFALISTELLLPF